MLTMMMMMVMREYDSYYRVYRAVWSPLGNNRHFRAPQAHHNKFFGLYFFLNKSIIKRRGLKEMKKIMTFAIKGEGVSSAIRIFSRI